METKNKPILHKNKGAEKHHAPMESHAVTPKIQTAEGWKRSMLKDMKKKKTS